MYRNNRRQIFGPKSITQFHTGPVYQRGEGIGSFLTNLLRKIFPIAKNVVKKVASSDIAKNVKNTAKSAAKSLIEHGVEAGGNMLADAIEGKNVGDTAKSELEKARGDIASIIRKNKNVSKEKIDVNDLSRKVHSKLLKRKKRTTIQSNKHKKYNLFHDA